MAVSRVCWTHWIVLFIKFVGVNKMELKSQTLKRLIEKYENAGELTIADLLRNDLRIALEREEYLRNKELWERV